MDPTLLIRLGITAANIATGAAGNQAKNAQDKQNYKDALAFQNASDKYARWSARINTKIANTSSKYRYWGELVNYNQNLAYVNQLRNFELTKAINQAKVVRETRTAAMSDYAVQAQALSEGVREQAMADAVSYYQYIHQGMKARSSITASEREGQSIDRLVNDYARQIGDMQAIRNINEGFRNRQYTRQQAGQVANYLSKYNSQQFYQMQPYQDPIKPFAPLPTLTMPQPPSMTGAGPSQAAANIGMANTVLGGINTGLNVWQGLQQFTSSGKPGGVPNLPGLSGLGALGG
jgi:hypothetical protein